MRRSPRGSPQSASGRDYCVVVKRGDVVFSFGDFCGLRPIFAYEKEGMIGISNRQRLLQKILNSSPQPVFNPESCAWMTGQANVFGEDSMYLGVRLVAPSRHIKIENGTLHSGGFPRFYSSTAKSDELSRDDVDTATNAVVDQARLLAELPISDLQMDLTGGMDSRAVLAVALSSGLISQVKTVKTYGPQHLPEFEVAEDIAAAFSLPFEKVVPGKGQPSSPDKIWTRLRYNATALDGTVSPDTGMPGIHRTTNLCLSGTGGELFRPHIHSRRNQTFRTAEEVLAMAENYQLRMDSLAANKDETNQALKQKLRSMAARYLSMGVAFDDVHYLLYIEHRMPWWAGYALSNVMGRRRLFPLVNKTAATIMYSTDPVQKKIDRFHFELMKKADHRLIQIPFHGNHWDARLEKYSDGLPIAMAPHQVRSTEKPTVGANAFIEFAESEWDKIFDYVLDAPSSVVFEFADRKRLELRRAEKDKWSNKPVAINSILSLVSIRMVEAGDLAEVKQGAPMKMEIRTNLARPLEASNLAAVSAAGSA